MTAQEILTSSLSKAEKARRLYDLGHTRHQVAEMICGGNYGWAHNIYKKHFGLATRSRIIDGLFNHKFGVEIEAFNVSQQALVRELTAAGISAVNESYNHTTRNHWKIVYDASVSGFNSFELVSPVLRGMEGIEQVKIVCQVLERMGAKVNKTCGLHVHFDASNLNIRTWRNLYKNYINVEAEIDSIMPASRRGDNNTYCRSMMARFRNKEQAFQFIDQANTVRELSQIVADSSRYMKVNAESFMRHGTVEFRQHSGTVEFQKISNWILLCGAMIDKSKTEIINALNDFAPETVKTHINQRKRKFAA